MGSDMRWLRSVADLKNNTVFIFTNQLWASDFKQIYASLKHLLRYSASTLTLSASVYCAICDVLLIAMLSNCCWHQCVGSIDVGFGNVGRATCGENWREERWWSIIYDIRRDDAMTSPVSKQQQQLQQTLASLPDSAYAAIGAIGRWSGDGQFGNHTWFEIDVTSCNVYFESNTITELPNTRSATMLMF